MRKIFRSEFATSHNTCLDIVSKGEKPSLAVWCGYIESFLLSGKLQTGLILIDKMRYEHPVLDAVAFHILIRAHIENDDLNGVAAVMEEMELAEIAPTDRIFATLLDYTRVSNPALEESLLQHLSTSGVTLTPDCFIFSVVNNPTSANIASLLEQMRIIKPPVIPSGRCLFYMLGVLTRSRNFTEAYELAQFSALHAKPEEYFAGGLVCT